MKVLGIIPARYASSRFPGKPLIDIKGKSMIQRVYEGAKKSSLITELVVATDDARIVEEVERFGGNVVMTAQHHQSGTERCGEVIESFNDFDVVINIQGDEPLIKAEQLDQLLAVFNNKNVEIATLIKKISATDDLSNPNRIKVVKGDNNQALYFSRSPIPFCQGEKLENWLAKYNYYKHIGIYAWRLITLKKLLAIQPDDLEQIESLEQLRWLRNGYKIQLVETTIETPNIDSPEDLQRVLDVLS